MPYKFEVSNLKISKKDDRRVKLTDQQRSEIFKLYHTISQRKLAKLYGVSKRLIQFIGDPRQLEENKLKRNEKGGSKQYYNSEYNTLKIREHRKYKYKLYKQSRLK